MFQQPFFYGVWYSFQIIWILKRTLVGLQLGYILQPQENVSALSLKQNAQTNLLSEAASKGPNPTHPLSENRKKIETNTLTLYFTI